MDAHVKEGQLYVQHQKFGKKWKKNWFVLYPASQNGIARLEFFDSPSGAGGGSSAGSGSTEKTRKLDKKIIRLSECISILPSLTENCPKDNMAAFCVETNDKTHVFCAERSTAKEWMDTMCDIAFQGGGNSDTPDPSAGAQDLQMSENLIYFSRDEVDEFWVSVQSTDASNRCGLSGSYWLKAESDALILKEPKTRRKVQVWPYKLLRRYGRDRVMFSFEAGRRCDSGPGNFTFDTKQGNEIFSLVDQAIQSQKALAEEMPSSLQFLCSAGAQCSGGDSSREAEGDSGGSKPSSGDEVLSCRERQEGETKGPTGNAVKGRGLPDTPALLGRLGSKGTLRIQAAGGGAEQAGLYSEPADYVHPLKSLDALYSDPVDSLKAQNHTLATPRPPDLYSQMYDHITMEMSHKTGALSLNAVGSSRSRGAAKSTPLGQGQVQQEHIYDEPEGCAKGSTLPKAIYDEATAPSGQECHYNGLFRNKVSEEHKHSSLPLGPPPLGKKWLRTLTAPKPAWVARNEAMPPSNVNNNNNVRGGSSAELYSKVSKQKSVGSCYSKPKQEQRPDLIYNNLGNI
ncbi:docking protein 1b [Eucyclogobius newberryi]|uniref:docking protein 1b n=1 Tax=Eucyclogobius newberryi TaxID=166745 RepID=UPI003B5B2D1F